MFWTTKQLVIVSGPPAAGKTTFLNQLKAEKLSPEIASLLPGKCQSWPLYTFGQAVARKLYEKSPRNLLLHVSSERVFRQSQQSQLLSLLRPFNRITAVHIVTPKDVLTERMRQRCSCASATKPETKVGDMLAVLDKYNRPGWVEDVYADFHTLLHLGTQVAVYCEHIFIEPYFSGRFAYPLYRWKLCDSRHWLRSALSAKRRSAWPIIQITM